MTTHKRNPIQGEFTLCGIAFDAADSGDADENPVFAISGGMVDCEHCRQIIASCVNDDGRDRRPSLWLGGIEGRCLTAAECEKYPAIAKLGREFSDFQNSPYRGEWNQVCRKMNFGELRTLLLEIAGVMNEAK